MTVREIERELARLREASTEPGAPPRLRTSVMTHIAWVPERWVDQATETLADLAERHPSRTIILFPRPDDVPDRLDGEFDLRCFVQDGERREVCSEVISLALCGARASVPASIVTPLLVSDLPVFLRWRGRPGPWALTGRSVESANARMARFTQVRPAMDQCSFMIPPLLISAAPRRIGDRDAQ